MVAYFAIVPLDIKIFILVKKTSERAVIRRGGSVTKKIAVLVMTMIFSLILPIVIAFLWLTINLKDTMSPQNREISTGNTHLVVKI